jgi:hypothetical protein
MILCAKGSTPKHDLNTALTCLNSAWNGINTKQNIQDAMHLIHLAKDKLGLATTLEDLG